MKRHTVCLCGLLKKTSILRTLIFRFDAIQYSLNEIFLGDFAGGINK